MLFQWQRFKIFLRQLLKSRRAVIGIGILIFYTTFALAAPYLTPYSPIRDTSLSGNFAPPSWWNILPGESYLSRNLQIVPTGGFTSPSSLQDQGWNTSVNTNTTQGGNFHLGYNPNEVATITVNSTKIVVPVREQVDYDRAANAPTPPGGMATITIAKTFTWPYTGPPFEFDGFLQVLPTVLQGVSSIGVTVFVAKGSVPNTIFTGTLTNQSLNGLIDPGSRHELDSKSSSVQTFFNNKDPAPFIFYEQGNYTYGVTFTIPDQNASQAVSLRFFVDDLSFKILGTSWGLLGTDEYGRDIFTQLAWGTRVSLLVGLLASFVAIAIGLVVGLLAGYMGRLVDEILMRTTDLLLVLPSLPLLIILAALLGPSIWNIIAILAILSWPGFARIIRSQVLTLRERSFIEASRAAGSGVGHIIRKHIVPNVMGLTYVNLALTVPSAIVTEAALAFLGLRDPTVISWGAMLNDINANQTAVTNWWWILPPGLSIALLSLSFILIGYALDEMLNPKLRMRR
jgi:peptide/nickel transport system permease protein